MSVLIKVVTRHWTGLWFLLCLLSVRVALPGAQQVLLSISKAAPRNTQFTGAKEKPHYLENDLLPVEMGLRERWEQPALTQQGQHSREHPSGVAQVPSKAEAGTCGPYLLILSCKTKVLALPNLSWSLG